MFEAGHRVRVEISSSNFPRFDRNTNSGKDQATATREDCLPALQRVFHDGTCPSIIVLPVVGERGVRSEERGTVGAVGLAAGAGDGSV